mgnify:FL=1
MQELTQGTIDYIKNDAQSATPSVVAEWVNGRTLTNVKAYSSSDEYRAYIQSLNPLIYYRLNESFDYVENVNTGPKPVTHWRMNTSLTPSIYSISDEVNYSNLSLVGTAGTNYKLKIGRAHV